MTKKEETIMEFANGGKIVKITGDPIISGHMYVPPPMPKHCMMSYGSPSKLFMEYTTGHVKWLTKFVVWRMRK